MQALSLLIFGFYIGGLSGLSASPVTMSLLPFLFTFAGGSVFAFFGKMTIPDRKSATRMLGLFFLGATIGTLVSIYVNSHSLLGPKPVAEKTTQSEYYLRADKLEEMEATLILLESGALKGSDAAQRIREVLRK